MTEPRELEEFDTPEPEPPKGPVEAPRDDDVGETGGEAVTNVTIHADNVTVTEAEE